MKGEISEKFEKAVEVYSNNTIIRATINAIPYVGGSLDVLISSRGHKIVQERIKSLLEQLRVDTSTLKENKIDRTFLESEEWFDLVVKTFESAARTRDSEKIRLYSKILRNSLIENNHKIHNPEDYLTVLAELTSREVELAKVIYAQQNDNSKENFLESELQMGMAQGMGKS